MAPFVFGAAKPAHAEDHHLSFARRKSGFGEHMAAKYKPTLQKLRMPRESRENVEHSAIPLERLQNLFDFVVPLGLWKGRNTWLLQAHAAGSFSMRFGEFVFSWHGTSCNF